MMFSKRQNLQFVLVIAACSVIVLILFYTFDSDKYKLLPTHYKIFVRHKYAIAVKLNLSRDTGNVPPLYVDGSQQPKGINGSCAKYPSLANLRFTNTFWQVLETSNETKFNFLNAYLDNRQGNYIRIISTINKLRKEFDDEDVYCQIWWKDRSRKPTITEPAVYLWTWLSAWGRMKGKAVVHIISCKLPEEIVDESADIESVSLVEDPCDSATNNIEVIKSTTMPAEREYFAVCVRAMDFWDSDNSHRLIEWIEFVLLMGASKVFFYDFTIPRNMRKVLDYYQTKGKVELTPLMLPDNEPNIPVVRNKFLAKYTLAGTQNELIALNDCFYKNIHAYKYVALLDVDEIIVPLVHNNWTMMVKDLESEGAKKNKTYDSFNFRNLYFLDSFQHEYYDDIPRYMHMLQHVTRATNYSQSGYYTKSFHGTARILSVHNHYPRTCPGYCQNRAVDYSFGHLQHYRTNCRRDGKKLCAKFHNETMVDKNIWRFKDELIARVVPVVEELQLD